MIENYTRVQLLTDRHQEEGVKRGAVGYIIEVYDNGEFEIEFSQSDGSTYAQITAQASELSAVDPVMA